MKLTRILLVVALGGLCFSASAQWQWIDKDGHKVFSDRAPPPEIQDKNILKRPAGRAPAAAVVSEEAAGADASPAAAIPLVPSSGGKPLGQDKELEAKKQKAKEAEDAKRKAAEEQLVKARIENCARAKQAKVTFDSGVRLTRPNLAGQQEVMDDAARAEEVRRIQGIIAQNCK